MAFVDWKNEALTNQKVKSLIDFDKEYSASIRSVAIEKNAKANLTTRFLSGKMLMFSKVSSCVWFDWYFYVSQSRNSRNLAKISSWKMLFITKLNWHRQRICIFCFYLWFKLFHQRRESSKYNILGNVKK